MLGRPANDDMVQGYMDGLDMDCPEPSANRSRSYCHGFANGRADRSGKSRGSFDQLVKWADEAMAADDADLWPVVGGVEYHVQIDIKRDPVWTGKCRYCPARFLTAAELQEHEKECPSRAGSHFT